MAANGQESQQAMPNVGVVNEPSEKVVGKPPRRRPVFLLGVLLFLLGPALYFVMLFGFKYLGMAWYVPILMTAGVLLMFLSVWQRPGVVRGIALALFLLLLAGEWYLVLVATRAPAYTGPAQVGTKLPVFTTSLADGTTFTNKDLESGVPTALVFFRGHW